LKETSVGVSIANPLSNWAVIQLGVDYIHPRILGVSDNDRPSVTELYDEESAPGILERADFLRVGTEVRFKFEPAFLKFSELTTGYAFYHDLDSRRYSFRQFRATSRTEYDVLIQTEHTGSNRSAVSTFLCTPKPAKECSLGTLAVFAGVTLAQTSANSQVPFYSQPTLGGADIQGRDTLRGFRDYRFRAPNMMLLKAEYRHGVWGPVGFLSFIDLGLVAPKASDLAIEHMRHGIGVGAYFSAGNIIVLRMYVGFGTGEGIRPNAKLAGSL
jgi:hypothetical protein